MGPREEAVQKEFHSTKEGGGGCPKKGVCRTICIFFIEPFFKTAEILDLTVCKRK